MKTPALVLAALILLMPFSADAAVKWPVKPTNISCTVEASSKLVKKGEKVTLSWSGSHAILAYGPDGTAVPLFGSMDVYPTTRTIYKFKFLGIGGNEKCGVRVRVLGETVPQ